MTTSVAEFEACVRENRAKLHAFCYRMLGSLQDADDALQEALLGAFRGLSGFEGRSSLRSWLYRVASNACIRLLAERPRRRPAHEYSAAETGVDVRGRIEEPVWLEPYPAPSDASFEELESVELAFVAALQHLPATQRAALILFEVLGFEAAEAAQVLDTSVPALNSALQRARKAMAERAPAQSQQKALAALGTDAERALVTAFVDAWARSDVPALVQLLSDDVRFSMPPLPSWFDGREAVTRFLVERVFQTAWRLVPLRASGQLAFGCYQGPEFRMGALNVVDLRGGQIVEMTGFLEPAVQARFSLPLAMSLGPRPALSR
ncbi:MAG: RNA polymerase subunit sigma-70 [Polyangiaceae bacterium]